MGQQHCGGGPPSLNPEGFNLDMEFYVHFEPIPLTYGDTEVRAIKRGDGVGAANVLLRRW